MMKPSKLFYAITTGNTVLRTCLLVHLIITSFIILCHGVQAADVFIGAIIDVNSRIGKEQRVAMALAVQHSNSALLNCNLALHLAGPERDILRAAATAEALINEKKVKVIIGMETWGEAALVADIGSRHQVPVLSFAEAAIAPSLTTTRWPFLVRMANNRAEQIRCIAALVGSYNWRRVTVIYEDDEIGGNSGDLVLLTEALQDFSSEIENRLVLPPFSYLTNPKEFIVEELDKLRTTQSRVFIVLQSSSNMMIHLFREAKRMGLLGTDSVWIVTDSITSLLDSVNTSVISSMEGALGIRNYFSEEVNSYQDFKAQFRRNFRSAYPEEDDSGPGFHSLRAYDSVKTVAQTLDNTTCEVSLEKILSSNFTGLSGNISFEEGRLLDTPRLRVVKVVGKKYKELDFWLPEFGFSNTPDIEDATKEKNSSEVVGATKGLSGSVFWPGDIGMRDPKGWAMPTNASVLKIIVPARTSFEKFVKVTSGPHGKFHYEGFCIDLFNKVLVLLHYDRPYEFFPYNGTYNDLVNHVANKTYDAAVGDITILADRARNVEFTVPYAESGLSLIVQAKTEGSAWMFIKPFTWQMWAVTAVMLIYTMIVVWLLEHQQNSEFNGPWNNQIGIALWFTFSSLFFAHRERISSNFTRLVVLVWLFVVLILSSSYTANLSSMLTVQRLKPNVTDIEWLTRSNLKVGCDGDSFVRTYLENVLHFKSENIFNVSDEYKYQETFENNTIAAAFLELPYEKVFITEFCKGYTATKPTNRFGGLGFAFQKGSPIAADFSEAILKLSENGELKLLEEKWFAPSPECSENVSNDGTESLRLQNFWGLYVISGVTSTLCAVIFMVKLLRRNRDASEGNITSSDGSFWNWSKVFRLSKYYYNGRETNVPGKSASTFAQKPDVDDWSSSWEYGSSSPADTPNNLQGFSKAEVEIQDVPAGRL